MAAASAYSSASHVDSATTRCFLLLQLTGSPLSFATQPLMDLRSPLSLAQSASAKAHTSTCTCVPWPARVAHRVAVARAEHQPDVLRASQVSQHALCRLHVTTRGRLHVADAR